MLFLLLDPLLYEPRQLPLLCLIESHLLLEINRFHLSHIVEIRSVDNLVKSVLAVHVWRQVGFELWVCGWADGPSGSDGRVEVSESLHGYFDVVKLLSESDPFVDGSLCVFCEDDGTLDFWDFFEWEDIWVPKVNNSFLSAKSILVGRCAISFVKSWLGLLKRQTW